MSGRSVIETLDLHNDYGDYHSDSCSSQSFGWLSPRVSFSTDFINGSSSDRISPSRAPEKKAEENCQNTSNISSPDFEFSMSSFNVLGNGAPGFIVPADELFHKGKLLPGFMPPNATAKDAVTVESTATTSAALLERPVGSPVTTIARHLSTEGTGGPSPLGCVLGPSCLRTPKGPKWRELFGALRRVKSDSGRQRIPDESLLPPKTMHGRKKFFKQFFSAGNGAHDPNLSTGPPYVASTRPSSSVSNTSMSGAVASASQGKTSTWDASSSALLSPSGGTPLGVVGVDFRNRVPAANAAQPSSSEAPRGREQKADFRGKGCDQSSEGFTFNPIPGRARPSGSGSSNSSSSNAGRMISSPMKTPIRGANLGRSASGRVIVRGLDRVSSGRNPTFQEHVRALRSREIRRSPERSGYANVRVTPVLNVPVCMGPVLRGASKVGKGRLSNFRSFLTFKSKLPNSMSTPIATR